MPGWRWCDRNGGGCHGCLFYPTMPVAAGDALLITKNSRHAKNGDLRRVKSCNEHQIVLDNGRKLDPSKALHVRQGHTVTSQVSQSKEREKMFALALSSGLSQINATQALVSVSRAQSEARINTDSFELLEEAVMLETGHREAAIDFLDAAGGEDTKRNLKHVGYLF